MLTPALTPSTAFQDATQRLRAQFAPMMAETADMMQLMRDAVVLDNLWTYQRNDFAQNGDWLESGPYHAFGKAVTHWDGAHYNLRALSEKLLCDLTYDLGLPSATCAFQHVANKDNIARSHERLVSVVPFGAAFTVDKIVEDTSAGLTSFFTAAQALTPAFMAQSLADVWFGNSDRLPRNLVVDDSEAPSRICGIDLGMNCFTSRLMAELNCLAQRDLFCSSADDTHAPVLQTTLTAIETMPREHIWQTANRLTPHSGADWNAEDITNILVRRQYNVRYALLDVLGSRKMDQLGLA